MLCVREFVCVCTCERGAGKLFRAFQCLCDLVYSPPAMIESLVGTEKEQCGSVWVRELLLSTHGAMVAIKRVYMRAFMRVCLCVRARVCVQMMKGCVCVGVGVGVHDFMCGV